MNTCIMCCGGMIVIIINHIISDAQVDKDGGRRSCDLTEPRLVSGSDGCSTGAGARVTGVERQTQFRDIAVHSNTNVSHQWSKYFLEWIIHFSINC